MFSYADAPGTDEVRFAFTTGRAPSHVKQALINGDVRRLYLDSSGGDFVLRRSRPETPIILLASGIGITPFCSMLAAASSSGDLRRFTVIHVVRNADRRVYDAVLDAARRSGASVHVVESAAGADGIDDDLVRDLVGGPIRPPQYYVSGNPGFVRSTAGAVRRVDPSTRLQFWRVHTDEFLGY